MKLPIRSRRSRRKAAVVLAGSVAALLIPKFAAAVTFIYDNVVTNTPGTATQWSAGTNWNSPPVSDPTTTLTFGNGATLATGRNIFSNNDVASPPFKLNAFNFTYAGPTTGISPKVTLSGNQLELVNNGVTTPTMVVNAGGSVKPTVAINNALKLTNNLAATITTDATLRGQISGGGSVVKTGAGTLTLTGESTFTGGLTVSAGTANFYKDENLGAASNAVTLSGGILQSNAAYSSHPLAISSASTIEEGFGTTLWNGPLTGSGTLTKTGPGRFFFAGSAGNSFSGDLIVAVNGGILQFGGSASSSPAGGPAFPNLTSANTITVNAGGMFGIEDRGGFIVGNYVADRFGSAGNRPNVKMTGGTFYLNAGITSGVLTQTLGPLTLASDASTFYVNRFTSGTPELIFSSLTRNTGAFAYYGGTNLGTGSNDARILFTTAPTLIGGGGAVGTTTVSILPAAINNPFSNVADLITYGANGIRALTASEYNSVAGNDINGVGATENVKIANTTPTTVVPLSAPRTINALVVTAAASLNWAMGNTLTITSGQILHTPSNSLDISSGVITAGTGAVGTVDLDVTVADTLSSLLTIRANIQDNASTTVALVKNGFGRMSVSGSSSDNTFSGGTFVNEGTLSTGTTASRRYLGSGAVVVGNAGSLSLGATGATSFSGSAASPTYTVKTGGTMALPNTAAAANEFFKVESGAVISYSGATGAGGLDLDVNLNAARGAIFAESSAGANLAIKKGGVAIATAITTPTYFFGLVGLNIQDNITVGAGTPWLGISSSRGSTSYNGVASTNNTITANGDFILQGLSYAGIQNIGSGGLSTGTLSLGAGPNATNIIKIATPNGDVTANIVGSVGLNNNNSQFGSAGNTVVFNVTMGGSLSAAQANAQGVVGGAAVSLASIVVQNGGILSIGNPGAINGNVTILPGGAVTQSQSTLTGTGVFTHSNGSILNLSTGAAVSGATQDLGTVAGTIVRINILTVQSGNTTAGATDFDSRLNDAAIYELTTSAVNFSNAAAATDSLFTLSASGGVGGMLTNDSGSRMLSAATGLIAIGSGGGTFAATTGTTLNVTENFALGANTLTIGAAQSPDGNPKLGTVILGTSTNTASAGSVIVVINGATLQMGAAAGAIPDLTRLTVNTGGTANLSNLSDTVESLTGGGTVTNTGTSATLTISSTTTDANFSGDLTATTPANLGLTKSGPGTQTLSGTNTYAGATQITNGTLKVNGSLAAGSTVAVSGSGILSGNGTANGSVTVGSGAAISPGDGIGTLTTGSVSLTSAASVFKLEIDLGVVPGADLLSVMGSVSLGGSTLDVSLLNATPAGLPKTFLIVANDFSDGVTGTFATITGLPGGYAVTVNYAYVGTDALGRVGTGNDVAVTISVPEPTTAAFLVAGLPLLACGRWRRMARTT